MSQFRVRSGFVVRALLVLIIVPTALYGFLLILQAYSAWQATRTLDRLEALRLGDPAADFDRAVRSCRAEFGTRTLTAGAYRFDWIYSKLWNLAPPLSEGLYDALDLGGLHYWRLNAADTVQDGRIADLSVGLMDVGRGETFGAQWRIASTIPERCLRRFQNKNTSTCVSPFAITNNPGGEGYQFFLTDQSSERDLNSRIVNRSCLFPLHSCRSISEFLPRASGLIQEQNVSISHD